MIVVAAVVVVVVAGAAAADVAVGLFAVVSGEPAAGTVNLSCYHLSCSCLYLNQGRVNFGGRNRH